jgi:hypothetical protein
MASLSSHLCWHQATNYPDLVGPAAPEAQAQVFLMVNPDFSSQLLIVKNHHASIIFEWFNHCFFQPFLGG